MKSNATDNAIKQRKVYLKTYGCQMNVYDSERMQDALQRDGFEATDTVSDADLVILNTCHIREKAAEKVYSEIGRLRELKRDRAAGDNPLVIGVTGCVAQAEGAAIFERAPAVDFVAGPQTYHRLGDVIRDVQDGSRRIETGFEIVEKFSQLPPQSPAQIRARGVAAFLTVQEGCDKFCTFCVVPYTRGAEVSRAADAIIEEARRMAGAGVREITLLGQNVNAWRGMGPGGTSWSLGDLLFQLSEIPGIARLRYTTSHPVDMDETLISAHAELTALMPYLHLPLQAGSDAILKAMNRHHTLDEYVQVIERVRTARPDIAISGDFIVGFPGETDADFEQTMSAARAINYASAFSFKYSRRPGTPGSDMENQIDEDVKNRRLTALQELLGEQQFEFNQAFVGREMEVLIEKPGRREGQMIGRSPWLQSVVLDDCAAEPGAFLMARIASAGPNSLRAVAGAESGS